LSVDVPARGGGDGESGVGLVCGGDGADVGLHEP